MRLTLENSDLRVSLDSLGGELKSLVDKKGDRELIWQADPAWWKGSAPLLFPIVGGLRGGRYKFGGGDYKLAQHGFARTSEFELVSRGAESAEFRLASSPATREVYPFDFELRLSYTLGQRGLWQRARVMNPGRQTLLFSLGFHPAFNLPLGAGRLENHYILFDSPEDPRRWFFKDGLVVAGKTAEVFENSRVIGLSRALFEDGPVILRSPRSRRFSLVNGQNGQSLSILTGPVPNLALWSKPGAPFVCVEPWYGLPDFDDSKGVFDQKPDLLRLEPGLSFEAVCEIEVPISKTDPSGSPQKNYARLC